MWRGIRKATYRLTEYEQSGRVDGVDAATRVASVRWEWAGNV
jgi:hypothetical protein